MKEGQKKGGLTKKSIAMLLIVASLFIVISLNSYGDIFNCGTNPDTADIRCFADAVAYADDTVWCGGALGTPGTHLTNPTNNDGAAVGADCDSIADDHGRKGCKRPGTQSQPNCDNGDGILILDMAEGIVNANNDWDLVVREGGAGEPFHAAVSADGNNWIGLGEVCSDSLYFNIPGANNAVYRYVKIEAEGRQRMCNGGPYVGEEDYGADIMWVMARVIDIPCTNECSLGQAGCQTSTQRWFCGNNDADSCFERVYVNCPGGQTCTGGNCVPTCIPAIEVCNGLDDDCDGLIDDGVAPQVCGSGACSGIRNCVNGAFGDCSTSGNLCSTLDCDPLDTACRNYNDVNLYCDENGGCGAGVCNDFFNQPAGTNCGSNITEYGCPWGNDFDDDTGLRIHEFECDGLGSCGENINPWQVDEECNSNQFCFWDGLGNGDANYFCQETCTPAIEVCNGLDDDCDGIIDDNLGGTICGVGACQRTVQNCVNGVPQICIPGNPTAEVCNGIDDDCDGLIDDGIICPQQCTPGEMQVTTCGVTNIGACELGLQNRTCEINGLWSDWGDCAGNVDPSIEVCNGLDDDCDGLIDENNVCINCNLNRISIRGRGGDIQYINGFTNIDEENIKFSAWLRRDNSGIYSGILSLNLKGKVNGENIRLTTKGKVREVFENTCQFLFVDNSYWSLATYQAPGEAPIPIIFDSIVYNWDKANGLLDIYGLGPFLNFNVTGINIF